jgi:hypothetical protein
VNEGTSGALWYRRGESFGAGLSQVTSHLNDLHADGEVVDAEAEPATNNQIWRAEPSPAGLLQVSITPSATPGAPPVWFVFVPEPQATPSAVNLVAYSTDALRPESAMPAGTVVSTNRFPTLGVPNDTQVAAIRWYPANGLIHQVYVNPSARRQSLGTVMIYTASAVHQAHGWTGSLHGDGRRTEIGEQFVAGLRHPQRIAPLSEVQPPMD